MLGRIKKNIDVLIVASLQKKYKKMEENSNKTAKLAYSEPILREKLNEVKDKNEALLQSIELMS